MDITVEAIIFYLILIDAVGANITAWTGIGEQMFKKFGVFTRYFPITRGWTTYYLVLVLWIGCALLRLGVVGL